MKIIDILNKIANGEQPPKKILVNGKQYELADNNEYYCFEDEGLFEYLFSELTTDSALDKEVEILETTTTYKPDKIENNKQDKIEKLSLEQIGLHYLQKWEWKDFVEQLNKNFHRINLKINEIIEAINER